ncbi:MAG: hypothetical protein F6K26_25860 [Moorea sp. SIO2I5]|nr:hypothetical protein [Moorena sp. SIO2I5]
MIISVFKVIAKGIGNRESGIGNRESGIGNRESGIGNREQGTVVKRCDYFVL